MVVDDKEAVAKGGSDAPETYGDLKVDYELKLAVSTLQQKPAGAIRQSRAP